MKYLNNQDFNKNQILNVAVQNLVADPSSPSVGQIYFHTTNKRVYIYEGSTFVSIPKAGDIVNADIASGAAIALTKLATDPLARANHTGTQVASTISNFDTQVRTSRLDQMAQPTATVNFNSQILTGLAAPSGATDAVNKNYVDNLSTGLDSKAAAHVATTANITLSGTQTIDGVALVAGDRVLVKNQTDGTQNGLYTVAAGAWPRSTDADTSAEVKTGMYVFIELGTVNGGTSWTLQTANPITLGTTSLTFVQFSGAGSISGGAGLVRTGSSLDVGAGLGITVNVDDIQIKLSGSTLTVDSGGLYVSNGGITATQLATSVAGAGLTGGGGTALAVGAGTGISVAADTVGIAAGGVTGTELAASVAGAGLGGGGGSALSVNVDGTSISITTDTLGVVAAGITATHLASSVAGAGLVGGAGTPLAVGGTTNRISVAADAVDISASYVGQTSITTLGTITTGTWTGTTIAVLNGGTGATTAVGARTNLGATGKFVATVGNASATSFVVTHNLGSQDVSVSIRETASPYNQVMADVQFTTTNTLTVFFAVAPAASEFTVTVIG